MIGKVVFLTILTLSVTGCSGLMTRSLGGMHDKVLEQAGMLESDRAAKLESNMHALQMALEMYAVDHAGTYPLPARLFEELDGTYLEAGRLPASPWGADGEFQANALDADAIAGWPASIAKGTVLGPGQVPSSSTFTHTTYGALVYRLNSARQEYDLYAVGRDGNVAVVAAHLFNH